MITPAFSTTACPHDTLEEVVRAAGHAGFPAVELRTFGVDSRNFACDPALTSPDKVRRIFAAEGVAISSLATGIRFDAPISPPVVGVLLDHETAVRAGKLAIDLAAQLSCPFVRVFAHEIPQRQTRGATLARIVKRLATVVDHARNTPVRVVIENGGSFPKADDLAEIIDRIDNSSTSLAACYALAPAVAAGDDPLAAASTLRSSLALTRIKDIDDSGRPCALGTGTLPVGEFVRSLVAAGNRGHVIFEWDRAWLPDLDPAEKILPEAAKTLFGWLREKPAGAPPTPAHEHAHA